MIVNNETVSINYRSRTIDKSNKKILITNLLSSEQEKDLTIPPNCRGYGRIRHFRRGTGEFWPENPLPIDPAVKALKLQKKPKVLEAQVFQTASCNWRCWYCFVPYNLLSANKEYSSWLSPDELIDFYLEEENRPSIIDLSGGQPELVPELVLWTMEALTARKLEEKVFLWSDDNLSNDFFWRYLSTNEVNTITSYKNYSRVGCFKGFDEKSFSFNTNADPKLFDQQFELMKKYIETGINMYAYTTFTFIGDDKDLNYKMKTFIDRLQTIDENLPLRTIPLEIFPFSTVKPRINNMHEVAIQNQYKAILLWNDELKQRYNSELLKSNIADVPIKK
ncbi:hypothetical protein OCO53_26180 [Peribacillus frigoritolerans]|uniref:hypothetical protein n=1 Tax=Peribacillus frigoritolerans TaxID=450367 RepID=UPI0021CF7D40|nr:hypothetical protein [Peribacillus frigoritolerans]MCU6603930.1 hypothetical protein [Peribacillus frigoritolerans]